jgi:hypothetical protein
MLMNQKIQYFKMKILSKLTNRFNAIPMKFSSRFWSWKIDVEMQRTTVTKTILKKKNKVGGLRLSDFKACCEAIWSKIVLVLA